MTEIRKIASLLALLSCGAAGFAASPWASIPGNATVISVNGRNTSKKEFDSYVKMVGALYRNKHPSAKDEQLRAVRVRIRAQARKELLIRSLQYTNLCTNKVNVSKAVRTEMMNRYRASFCRRRQSFEDLRDFMREAEAEDAFLRCFEEDMKIDSALRLAYPEKLAVTDSDISNAVRNVVEYNNRAAATNVAICVLATNVLARIKAGGDFAALADEFSMDENKNPGGDLGECTIASFSEEGDECLAGVAALKVGDVSDIIQGNSGYLIIKKTGESSYSQIFFRKPYEMEVLSGAALVEELKKEKRTALLEELMPSFVKSARIEFPRGDIFLKFNTPKPTSPKKRSK